MLSVVLIKVISTKLKNLLGGIWNCLAVAVEWLLGAMSMGLPEYVHLWMATQGQRDQSYCEFS